VPDVSVNTGRQSAELLGQLARELSALVRRDVEVAAAERVPTLRRALLDMAALGAVAVAALFALTALTVAGGWALASALAGWAAALVVAGAWALVAAVAAAVLLRPRAQPREREELFGLLQMLSRKHRLDELQSSREEARGEAEEEMRQTSAALVKALLDEAAEHQVEALPAVAKREIGRRWRVDRGGVGGPDGAGASGLRRARASGRAYRTCKAAGERDGQAGA